MNKSTFKVTVMDCSAEEQMVRMKLEPLSQVERLDFDLPARKLVVYHHNEAAPIAKSLGELGLGKVSLVRKPPTYPSTIMKMTPSKNASSGGCSASTPPSSSWRWLSD
ncbi:hypothetical protein QWY85_12055 [Neolewinella lacunae]|nr:hypothetical protein [Neolewinella lacunae]MDN3635396.1 hypothetical protein [Neolewinella lacunae]